MTDHLNLKPLTSDQATLLHGLWIMPEIRRFLWDGKIIQLSQTNEIAQQSEAQHKNGAFGLWLARLHDANEVIGFTGFWPFFEPPQIQLIYGLDPSCWGRGFAKEMASAMISQANELYGIERILAATDPPNKASIGVLKNLGMTQVKAPVENAGETLFFERQQI